MKKIINYTPEGQLPDFLQDIDLLAAYYEEDMDKGYALPVITASNNHFTWLVFKEVEDHIDGNGLAALYLAQGQGTFYLEGSAINLAQHDIIIFSDKLEHGFSAKENCLALNMPCSSHEPSVEEIKNNIEQSIRETNEIVETQQKNKRISLKF